MRLYLEPTSVRHCPLQSSSIGVRSSLSVAKPVVRQPHCHWDREKSFEFPFHLRRGQIKNALSVHAEVSLEKEEGVKTFNWFKNWWPVQAVENLPTDRPYRIQLLGKHYVVWKGHSGRWIAMDDECPHRLAPLSEGRIEKDGNLLCSYHAWRFNESGKCVKIPHAEDDKAHHVACNSPRSAVQTYPCKTRGSLLWIWPDTSANAFADSDKVLLPIDDDVADCLERAAAEGVFYNYVRYMPYDFEVSIENLCDPSHIPVSHHSVFPIRNRYSAKSLEAKLVKGTARGRESVALTFEPFVPDMDSSQVELRKPGFVVITDSKKYEKVPRTKLFFAGYPTSVGRSVIIIAVVSQGRLTRTKRSTLLQNLMDRVQVFMTHALFQNAISDGDALFLHEQDKRIKKRGPSFSASKEYFVPTSADLLVMHFRKWFEEEAGSGAAYETPKFNHMGQS